MLSKHITHQITTAHIAKFASIVGDHNPVHSDPLFASKTRFKTPIAHGMLVLALLNHALPAELQIKSMNVRFVKPVYPEYVLSGVLEIRGGEFSFLVGRDGEQMTVIRGEVEQSCL